NGHVQPHQLHEAFIIVTQHVGKISCPVEQTIRLYMCVISILSSVNVCSNSRKSSNQVEHIVEYRLPVILFGNTFRISFGKFAFSLQCHDTCHEHGHGVSI